MERFETYLNENLPKVPSFHPVYEEALGVMLTAGGKRFRPMLLLSIVDAYAPMLYMMTSPLWMMQTCAAVIRRCINVSMK